MKREPPTKKSNKKRISGWLDESRKPKKPSPPRKKTRSLSPEQQSSAALDDNQNALLRRAIQSVLTALKGVGESYFASLIISLAEVLDVRYAFVGRCVGLSASRVRTISVCDRTTILDNIEYDLVGTPCSTIVGTGPRFYPANVKELFPTDQTLVELNVESYLGVPLLSRSGQILGLLTVMDDRPMIESNVASSLLQLFATRAGAELERLQMVQMLKESEQRFRILAEASFEGVGIAEDGILIEVNDQLAEMVGYHRAELIGKPVMEIFAPESLTLAQPAFREGSQTPSVLLFRNKEGNTLPVEVRVRVEKIGGKQVHMMAIQGLTERIAAEESLRRSEEKFSKAFHTSPDAININRLRDGLFLDVNEGFTALTGYSLADVKGKSSLEIELWADPNDRSVLIQTLLSKGEVSNYEAPFRYKNGRIAIGLMSARIIEMIGEVCILSITRDISERRRAEAALKESEQRFRTLAEAAFEGIALSEKGIFIDLNDQLARMLGGEQSDFIGRPVLDFIASESQAKGLEAAEQDRREPYELRLIRLDWKTIPVEVRARMIDLGGRRIRVSAIRDITERKQFESEMKSSEEALRLSENRLRQVIDLVPHFVFAKDINGKFILVNKAVADAYGTTVEKLIGKTDADFDQSETEVHHFREDDLEVIRRNEPKVIPEERITDSEGKLHYLQTIKIPFTFSGASTPAILGTSVDITNWKRAEEILRESELRYRSVVENTSDAIFTVDRQGTFLMVNKAASQFLNQQSDGVIGKTMWELFPKAFADRQMEKIREVFETGNEIVTEYPTTLDENDRWFSTKLEPVFDAANNVSAVQGFTRDTTERRNSEEVLRRTQKMESLGLLAGGIAHDFNNLLQAISGQIHLALSKMPVEDPNYQHLAKAEKTTDRAADLTKQLLAYSGRGKFNIQEMDLNTLIQENVRLLEVGIPKNVHLNLELSSTPMNVRADIAQMQQVIMNLIINAAEAMEGHIGEIHLRTTRMEIHKEELIRWRCNEIDFQSGDYVVLEVADDGCGMSDEILHKIFDPFFTTKFTGRGLGLAAVLGIILGHGGGLQVESAPAGGTIFRIALASIGEVDVPKISERRVPEQKQFHGVILLIDDEKDIRELFADIAADQGFQVLTAQDGEMGIECYKAHQNTVDLVLLDLSMPGIGGEETLHRLQSLNPGVKIILCSGYTAEDAVNRFQQIHPTGFLQKPYNWETVVEMMQQTIGHSTPGTSGNDTSMQSSPQTTG
ncbi:MAG: PAS domain S-box protein [bacterium]